MIQEERPAAQISVNDLVFMHLQSLREGQQELQKRMDRLERRMDKLEEKLDKQDAKFEKLADKIDDLRKEIKASQSHGQIATISSVGIGLSAVSITLGVLYSLLIK